MMRITRKKKLRMVLAALFTIHFSLFTSTQCASPSRDQLASLAAQGYYRHLAAGEYEQFLEGRVGADSLPADYREQLLAGFKQFVAQQQSAHQGIRDIQSSNVVTDSLSGHTNVFLILCYGDSTQEEIVVPMVEHSGHWRMK